MDQSNTLKYTFITLPEHGGPILCTVFYVDIVLFSNCIANTQRQAIGPL